MALSKEQEDALQAHLQDNSMMGKIRDYALKHKGWGTNDVDQVDQANNVDQVAAQAAGTPTAQPQHMDEGGFVDTLKQGANAALSTFGLPQMMNAVMPQQPAPIDPMAKPFAQEDEQSASYKPPFGNEAPAAMTPPPAPSPIAKTPKASSVAGPTSDKVADSHPGFNQDELEKYLLNEKGQMDKYGADKMADKYQALHDEQNSLGSTIARKMHGAADDIMMGVARAGNPGHERAFDEKQARERAQLDQESKSLNEANMASVKAKEGLDHQSNQNALGASVASTMLPVLKQLYPGKTDAQYMQMARNPAVAESLLPEGVKLRTSADTITAAKENHAAAREFARERMNTGEDDKYKTRLEKDSSSLDKDPNVVKAQGTLDKLRAAEGLLSAGHKDNATASQALQTAMTFVATGGQRVNEAEMKAFGGAKTATNHMNQLVKRAADGTLTEKDWFDISRVIPIYRDAAQRDIEDAVGRKASERAQREHIDPAKAREELGHGAAPAAGNQPPEITSQADYNALPSGASYTSGGVLHRKK